MSRFQDHSTHLFRKESKPDTFMRHRSFGPSIYKEHRQNKKRLVSPTVLQFSLIYLNNLHRSYHTHHSSNFCGTCYLKNLPTSRYYRALHTLCPRYLGRWALKNLLTIKLLQWLVNAYTNTPPVLDQPFTPDPINATKHPSLR